MNIIVVGHHSRVNWFARLQEALPNCIGVIDYAGEGAFAGHRKALTIAKEIGERCIIMEDDAIPVIGFTALAKLWCNRCPNDLISFYLGTGRPVAWQSRVDDALENTTDDYIMLSRLIHGVCYSIPTAHVGRVLQRLHNWDDGADFAIGRAWGRQVIYPVESLVEHRDNGSVERHPDGEARNEIRVARNLAAQLMYER